MLTRIKIQLNFDASTRTKLTNEKSEGLGYILNTKKKIVKSDYIILFNFYFAPKIKEHDFL